MSMWPWREVVHSLRKRRPHVPTMMQAPVHISLSSPSEGMAARLPSGIQKPVAPRPCTQSRS